MKMPFMSDDTVSGGVLGGAIEEDPPLVPDAVYHSEGKEDGHKHVNDISL